MPRPPHGRRPFRSQGEEGCQIRDARADPMWERGESASPSGPLSNLEKTMSEQFQLAESPLPSTNGASAETAPPNGRLTVRGLVDGQAVEGVFAVRERERRQKRDGGEWIRLVLADRTGTVEAVAWDGVDEGFDAARPRSGRARRRAIQRSCPQYGPKVTLEALRPARDGEYEPDDIAEGPPIPVERLEADLRELIATIQNAGAACVCSSASSARALATWARFREAPAAKYYHQAYPPRAARPHACRSPRP